MNHHQQTQETYRQIALDYAATWQKNGTVDSELKTFAALLPEGATVLDVGCGPGLDTAVLQSHHLNVIPLDYSHEMMRVGREEHNCLAPFIQADMRHLPIGQQVDGIWASASILHLPREDVLPTLRGFWRVLKPGGILYLSAKLGSGEAWVSTQKYGHDLPRFFTFWQADTLDAVLETAEFNILQAWVDEGKRDHWLVRYAQKRELKP
ncbi:MAG: class I SAM-dependent methyltransferase [Chloroflexota bacterium]